MKSESLDKIISDIKYVLRSQEVLNSVNVIWHEVSEQFEYHAKHIPDEFKMSRRELSFHEHTKFLIFATYLVNKIEGDICEIGVWKGKSLTLMQRASGKNVIGIDPLELPKQTEELNYFKDHIFPEAKIIKNYSELAISQFQSVSKKLSLLHIDGGHLKEHVVTDFILYSRFVVPGGFIIFDDYRDNVYSPEVGQAVDLLRVGGFFSNYHIVGVVPEYENSYLLIKK